MKTLTDKPFIVNIFLVPDLTKGEEIFEYIKICAQEKVAAIEFAGADVITIAGYEVAGHPSMDGIGTFLIANKAAKVCAPYGVPVLAAGGVADGKGLAAALALGAQGVVLGTRFVVTTECPISDNHKRWILDHTEKDTVLTQKSIHNMARVANNMAAKLTLEMEKRGTTLQELMTVIAGKLSRECYKNGNVDGGIFAVGPVMGVIDDAKQEENVIMGEKEAYKMLEGVKIVELSTMVAAGSCGRMLADWGANIVKVESESGDMFRNWPQSFYVPCTMDENPLFDNLNAGKRGIVLNLKTQEGMEAMHRLLAEADVFLTNTREKALIKLGLDYNSLKEKYPKLIVANLSGFGERGPKKDYPGFDTVAFWASSGFNADMMVDGPNSYPVYGSAGPGDIVTAMGLVSAIIAALYKRTQTGLGDRVTTSLYGTALWCFNLMEIATEEQYGYQYPKTRDDSSPIGSPFRTKDNEWVMTTILKVEEQWPKLCDVLGVPELKDDTRFNNAIGQRKHENRAYLIKLFEGIYATKTADEWCELLAKADIVHDKLAHYKDMLKSEQAWANEYIHEITCPNGKKSVVVRPAMRSDKTGIPEWKRGPMLGEHTDEILREIGYTEEEIICMKENGVAVQIDTSQYIKAHSEEEIS